MRSRSSIRIRVPLGIAIAALAAVPTLAPGRGDAHTFWPNEKQGKNWYFQGGLHEAVQIPTGAYLIGDLEDPVTFIFTKKAGVRATTAEVEEHVRADWSGPCRKQLIGSKWRVVCDRMKNYTSGSLCSAFSNRQHATWRKLNGAKRRSRSELVLATRCGGERWHMRIWSDNEHKAWTSNHGHSGQWAIGGIHMDVGGHGHQEAIRAYGITWNMARKKLVKKMGKRAQSWGIPAAILHCTWPFWKRHPGAHKRFGGRDLNSGWIARISMKHIRPGGCAGA